jgi:hypothetical protein
MPTLYSYATDEVDGSIFDNIQRRIAHTENASSFRMSEYPPKDITDGKADKFIEVLQGRVIKSTKNYRIMFNDNTTIPINNLLPSM